MNITGLLQCPKCKKALPAALQCACCGASYSFAHGVYDCRTDEHSADQTSFWKITDEILEDPQAFAAHKAQEDAWRADYQSRMNQETKDAERAQDEYAAALLGSMSGTVCDLATGQGRMLRKILAANDTVKVICTDIDPRILAWTRLEQETDDDRIAFVAADGRNLSFRDDVFDYVTSFHGLGNIPDGDAVAKELYRILKKGGQIIYLGSYTEVGSKSYELAKQVHVEQGLVEENLIACLRNAGFAEVDSHIVASAVWAENPYDLLPVAGDTEKYCVIRAVK